MNENGNLVKLAQLHKQEFDLCASDLFFFLRFVRTDDEDIGQIRYFPHHYEYLKRVNKDIEENQKTIILKSRRLLISWLGMMRMLHQALFAGTGVIGTKDTFRGGVMSIGETEATYLIERATKVYHRLPDWIKNRNPLVTDNKLLMRFKNGGAIQAFPLKREGPQTFGFTEVFFDEMALQDAARTTWVGMIPTLGAEGKVIAVSTPNGKFNHFYDLWANKNESYTDMKRVVIHWSENPEHDQAWYDKVTSGLDEQGIARMFELSFSHYAGDRVWNKYDRRTHVVEHTEIIRTRPLLVGWDFGFHFPAVVFAQRNTRDQFVVHREYVDYDIGFDKFLKDVIEFSNTFYDRHKFKEIHFVDPAGFQSYHMRGASGAVSDCHEIKLQYKLKDGEDPQVRRGAMEIGTMTNEGPRLKEVRSLFNLRADGHPGLVINEACEQFIDGCAGGYCYPEKGGETPQKNEYSHVQDGFQYLVTGYNKMFNIGKEKKFVRKKYKRIGHRTGI